MAWVIICQRKIFYVFIEFTETIINCYLLLLLLFEVDSSKQIAAVLT